MREQLSGVRLELIYLVYLTHHFLEWIIRKLSASVRVQTHKIGRNVDSTIGAITWRLCCCATESTFGRNFFSPAQKHEKCDLKNRLHWLQLKVISITHRQNSATESGRWCISLGNVCGLDIGNLNIAQTSMPATTFSYGILFMWSMRLKILLNSLGFLTANVCSRDCDCRWIEFRMPKPDDDDNQIQTRLFSHRLNTQ